MKRPERPERPERPTPGNHRPEVPVHVRISLFDRGLCPAHLGDTCTCDPDPRHLVLLNASRKN